MCRCCCCLHSCCSGQLATRSLDATITFPTARRLGNLNWRLAAGLAVGSVLGGAAGSQAAVHAPPYSLEAVFMVTLLALARMTLKSVR